MGTGYQLKLLNRIYILPQGATFIGRDASCQIQLQGELISRKHGRIAIKGDECTYEDLSSNNGSFVNNKKVGAATPLESGDIIRIAFYELKFEVVPKVATQKPTLQMKFCTHCGAVLSQRMKFCVQCGKRVNAQQNVVICPVCSETVTPEMRFCMHCGHRLDRG